MPLALHFVTLRLWMPACPQWLAPALATPKRVEMGGMAPQVGPLAPHRSRPELVVVVMACGSCTGGLPPWGASGTGPFFRQEGVYTPTAHGGAPTRGDGPKSLLGGGGGSPGGGRGAHFSVGRWRGGSGPSRRGTAAVSRAGRNREQVSPPPPHGWGCDWGPGEQGTPADEATAAGVGLNPLPPPPPVLASLQPATAFFCSWHGDHVAITASSKAKGEDAGDKPPSPPPLPMHVQRHDGLALLRWWYVGGGGGMPEVGGKGGAEVCGGRPCPHPYARRSASQAAS